MFVLMVIVLFFFREFGRIVVTFCIGFDTSIIILLILITVFRVFSIPELQDRSKLFHSSLLTLFGSFSFFNLLRGPLNLLPRLRTPLGFLAFSSFLVRRDFSSSCPLDKFRIKAWNSVF